MDLHLFVNRERENLYQAQFLADSARQRSAAQRGHGFHTRPQLFSFLYHSTSVIP